MSVIDLQAFRRNQLSQFGEDGILERLFAELGVAAGTFCEFGAWDGQLYSNTRVFFDRGWRGIYIEGDPERYQDLVRNVTGDRAELLCAYVRPTGKDSLDELLTQSKIVGPTKELDLLSIDIDSDDLAVWRGLTQVRPRVVIIEFNPTIPIDVEYVNPPGENKGSSAAAIHRFAQEAGYDLVAATVCNLVYVDSKRRPPSVPSRPALLTSLPGQKRYFWGYDGTLIVGVAPDEPGPAEFSTPELIPVPWKDAFFAQPMPEAFRRYGFSPRKNRIYWRLATAAADAVGKRYHTTVSVTMSHPVALLRSAARRLFRQRPQ
jgi:hypothetical protein